jgi:hypothetical protein
MELCRSPQFIWASCAQLQYSLAETPQTLPLPPEFGLIFEGTKLVSQDRRHLLVTPHGEYIRIYSKSELIQYIVLCTTYCAVMNNRKKVLRHGPGTEPVVFWRLVLVSRMHTAQLLNLREAHPEAVEVIKVQHGDMRRSGGSV